MLRQRFLSIAALGALSLAVAACGQATPPDPRTRTPLVRTALVTAGTSPERTFTGIVAARVQSDLGFRVSGKVSERLVDTGQAVRRGQPLFRIDPADLALAASAQDEAVAAARARFAQAAEEEARYRDLQGTGAISASAYDQVKAAADAAKAQFRAAESQASVARNAARYAELTADADGIVMETLAEPGQVVGAGQVVVRIARAGKREAVIQLPETLRPALGSVAQASVFGREHAPVQARLRQLSDVADKATRTFEARYVLEGTGPAQALVGSTVTVRMAASPSSTATPSVRVPLASLLDDGRGPAVWVVDGDRVRREPVAIAQVEDETAQVAGKLRPGERIVALGAHLLTEGARVQVLAHASANAVSTGVAHE